MTEHVRKAVIPAAGLGTRFLPATKAQPKEMLPVVDKPAIQYVVEEAVRGRHRRHPHHHRPRQAQPRGPLRPATSSSSTSSRRRASTTSSTRCAGLAELADIHYVRQGEPLGLGHAVSVARKHVGDEPFVVMLGDDIMDERSHRARGHDRRVRASTGALGGGAEGGPARGDLVLRLRRARARRPSRPGAHPRASSRSRSPRRRRPNLAVMGRYVFTPAIFDALDAGAAGRRRRDPAHRRHRPAARRARPVYGYVFAEGRFDIGKKLDYLRATVELALDRDDLGPEFRDVPGRRRAPPTASSDRPAPPDPTGRPAALG